MKSTLPVLGLVALNLSTLPVHAASIWTGNVGDYTTGTNWNPAGVPTASTGIEINSGAATNNGNLNRAANSLIGGGALIISNGRFLNASGGAATVTITDGSLQQTGNYFIVGLNNAGTLNQSGGTVTANVDRGFFLSDGGSSSGTYNLTGGTLNVNMSGSYDINNHVFDIGRAGSSDLLHINGGAMTVTNTNPATTDRRLYIKRNSTFQVTSGSAVIDNFRFFIVGRDNPGTTANALFHGGTTTMSLSDAFVMGGGGDAYALVSAGTLAVNRVGGTGGNLWLNDGGTTNSAIFEQTGGIVSFEGDILLGRTSTGSARYLMGGGTLFANNILTGLGPDSEFQFTGGQISLAGDRTSILGESWFAAVPGTFATYNATLDRTLLITPEPSVILLSALGLAALITRRRR
jgi:hypothetical protein